MKPSGIGGQAVIEGVMMKNKDQYAIAVRKPNNEIVIEKSSYISIAERFKILKLPIIRGMLAFVESMIIGTKTLTFSTSFYEEEEEVKPSKLEVAFSKFFKDKAEKIAMGITIFISCLLAMGIFVVLPVFISNILSKRIESEVVSTIIEGFIRILLFITYVLAISQVKDIKRMFMYHGAEHKTINCLENGFELTVENVKWQSKQHKRCGTSFMFIVMFISIIFFIFIRVDQGWLRILVRILLIPIIAGVSYEFIRLAGKSNSKVVNILSQPGMWMQGLTTKEPDDQMIEVAIQSVEAVFDWKEFLQQGSEKTKKNKKNNMKNKENNMKNKENSMKNKEYNKKNEEKENNKNDNKNNNNIKNNNNKAQVKSSGKKQTNQEDQRAMEESAITVEKTEEAKLNAIYGEEDDEILRALDRYLVDKKESIDKE